MCGIAGHLSARATPEGEALVTAIIRSQHRRGPDASGVEAVSAVEPQVVLGHNRLSIVDLSAASNQPLWDHERRVCLVFNGEIYNYLELRAELRERGHRFTTQGDSEVILEAFKAWGIGAISRFIGMFAFALWDAPVRQLWLVRDRFGVKPLFYRQIGDTVQFASSARVLARHAGLAPDLDYLADGIELKMYERDDSSSPYLGLHALSAGCWMRVQLDADRSRIVCEQQRYYDLHQAALLRREQLRGLTRAGWLEEVSSCLRSAINLRLRSDVPLGLSLSGGIDSSTIGALVARQQDNLVAFTFGSPDDAFSEGPNVAAIAAQAGIRVHYCQPSPTEIEAGLWRTLEAQGAPFPSGSIVAQHFVFKAARENGVIVLLGGQGADEGLMGYHKYKLFLLQDALRRRAVGKALSLGMWMFALLAAESMNLGDFWRERHRFLGLRGKQGSSLLIARSRPSTLQGLPTGAEPWERQVLDVTRFSLPTLLRYEDRNSMDNSIESRLPFMDHRMLELGLALPDAVKVRHGYGKWVLREVARGLIPENIRTTRKKRGFDVNLARWIGDGLGQSIRQRLADQRANYASYLVRPVDPGLVFSDRQLIHTPHAFAQAMTLLWLAHR